LRGVPSAARRGVLAVDEEHHDENLTALLSRGDFFTRGKYLVENVTHDGRLQEQS